MDQGKIREAALALQELLRQYASTNEAASALQTALEPLLQQALAGQLTQPVDWREVPGARTFAETDLQTLPELEHAYAIFKFAVTGGEPAWLQQWKQKQA